MSTKSSYPQTPNLDKMISVQDKSLILSQFVDWLTEHKDNNGWRYGITRHQTLGKSPFYHLEHEPINNFEKLFAEFFEIDYDGIERERRAILDHLLKAKASQ